MSNLINGYVGKEIGFIYRPNKPRFIIREIYKEEVMIKGSLWKVVWYNNGTFEKWLLKPLGNKTMGNRIPNNPNLARYKNRDSVEADNR